MSLRVFILSFMSILCGYSVVAVAQTGDGYVGIYADSAGTEPCATIPQYTSAMLYVVARTAGATQNGITGAEFRIEVSNPTGWYISYTAPNGTIALGNPIDVNPDSTDTSGLNIAFRSCQQASANGSIRLGTVWLFNAGGSATTLLVKRHNRPSNLNFMCPIFTLCDEAVSTVCMTPYSGSPCSTAKPLDKATLRVADAPIFMMSVEPAPQNSEVPYLSVQIVGKVEYSGFGANKGIPDVRVELNWGDDPNDIYVPWAATNPPTQHRDYDITDMDGNFSFSFYVQYDEPANTISPGQKIHIVVNDHNTAGYDNDLPGIFPDNTTNVIDISSAIHLVSVPSKFVLESKNTGSALRHLYRAKQFALACGLTQAQLSTVRFHTRANDGTEFIGPNGGGPHINFDPTIESTTSAETGYHEYGHFVEWVNTGFDLGARDAAPHWFTKQTNRFDAWGEGWAEFWSAATMFYWYSREMPIRIENNSKNLEIPEDPVYQFMEAGQRALYPDRDNTKVEGSVACFLYNLWDKVTPRALGYQGDNDDVAASMPFILAVARQNYNVEGQTGDVVTFKNWCLQMLSAAGPDPNAIAALYNAQILRTGAMRPATPTSLQVSLGPTRLTWNDNTSPDVVSYTDDYTGSITFDLIENNELGFHVYRRPSTAGATWDSTLTGYTLMETVGAHSGSGAVSTVVLGGPSGTYSYVVVAYNASGDSRPRARAVVTLTATDTTEQPVPKRYALAQNSPNPFNPNTSIQFDTPKADLVKLDVYDVAGRWLTSLVNEQMEAGRHIVSFSGRGLSNGVYTYRLRAGDYTATKKMILVK